MPLDKETPLEKVTGSTVTTAAVTLLAAQVGTPLAALLPVLTGALASERHKKRVEKAIRELESELEAQKEKLKFVTDSQYKIINEAILAVFQTLDEEKLLYLRRVVTNAIDAKDIESLEAVLLCRVVRDISAEEVKFVLDNFSYKYIEIGGKYEWEDTLFIPEGTRGAIIANGLFALGVLVRTEQLMDSANRLVFSPLCGKLIALLNERSAAPAAEGDR